MHVEPSSRTVFVHVSFRCFWLNLYFTLSLMHYACCIHSFPVTVISSACAGGDVVLPWFLYFLFVFVAACCLVFMPSYKLFTDKIFRAHCES